MINRLNIANNLISPDVTEMRTDSRQDSSVPKSVKILREEVKKLVIIFLQMTDNNKNFLLKEICNSNKIQGPCLEFQNRWFLDTETKTCSMFKYGGCFGNENNFGSKIECRNFCWDYLSEEARVANESTESASVPAIAIDSNGIFLIVKLSYSNTFFLNFD